MTQSKTRQPPTTQGHHTGADHPVGAQQQRTHTTYTLTLGCGSRLCPHHTSLYQCCRTVRMCVCVCLSPMPPPYITIRKPTRTHTHTHTFSHSMPSAARARLHTSYVLSQCMQKHVCDPMCVCVCVCHRRYQDHSGASQGSSC